MHIKKLGKTKIIYDNENKQLTSPVCKMDLDFVCLMTKWSNYKLDHHVIKQTIYLCEYEIFHNIIIVFTRIRFSSSTH